MNCITFTRINTIKKRKKKLKLIDDYQYDSEEEQQQQTSKKLDKKEPLRKSTKDDLKEFNNEWIKREETGINHKLFQKNANFQRSSDLLKAVYSTNKKKKLKNETR